MKKRRFDKLMDRVPQELQELSDQSGGLNGWWKNDARNRPAQLLELGKTMQRIGKYIEDNLGHKFDPNLTEPVDTP